MEGKKVLVVDDERWIVRLIQVNLQRKGFAVVTAADGRQALEKVKSEKPNLMTLDIIMPYVDGFEVLQQIRQDPETENLPVIILSQKTDKKDTFAGYHYGADLYMPKPFNPLGLVQMIERILNG